MPTPTSTSTCVTFGCPNFISSDVPSIDHEISARIVHMYGEHEFEYFAIDFSEAYHLHTAVCFYSEEIMNK